jgi:hypothetical protein
MSLFLRPQKRTDRWAFVTVGRALFTIAPPLG